jgi:DNA-binding YbaB/EbfC family protein
MKQVQDSLEHEIVEGQAGAGLVKITMTCKNQVKNLAIDPSLMSADADDRETLQDLLIAAFNDAQAKAEAVSQQRMSAVTAGLPMPPGMKLF